MVADMNVALLRLDEAAAVVVSGDVGLAACPQFEAELAAAVDSGAERVVIDLSDVQSMDMFAAHALEAVRDLADSRGVVFRVVGLSEPAQRVLIDLRDSESFDS